MLNSITGTLPSTELEKLGMSMNFVCLAPAVTYENSYGYRRTHQYMYGYRYGRGMDTGTGVARIQVPAYVQA